MRKKRPANQNNDGASVRGIGKGPTHHAAAADPSYRDYSSSNTAALVCAWCQTTSRLSKLNTQPSVVAPQYSAGLKLLACHDKLKIRRNSNCGLNHKTCTDCRKITDRALHLTTSKKNLPGFEYPSTRNLAALVHLDTGRFQSQSHPL